MMNHFIGSSLFTIHNDATKEKDAVYRDDAVREFPYDCIINQNFKRNNWSFIS